MIEKIKLLSWDSRGIGGHDEHVKSYEAINDIEALCGEYVSLHEAKFIHDCKDRWSSDDYEYSRHLSNKSQIVGQILRDRGVIINYSVEVGHTFDGIDGAS